MAKGVAEEKIDPAKSQTDKGRGGADAKKDKNKKKKDEGNDTVLDKGDIALLMTYGHGPYHKGIRVAEMDLKRMQDKVKLMCGVKESDTGLALPSLWDTEADKQMMQQEQPLQVARCTKIIDGDTEEPKYMITIRQMAKFVVGLGEKVSPTDVEEGMRVGCDRTKYAIQIPLPPKIDPSVTMMTVEEKPDVTYDDVGGAKDAIQQLREVVEIPLLHPERFVGKCLISLSPSLSLSLSCSLVRSFAVHFLLSPPRFLFSSHFILFPICVSCPCLLACLVSIPPPCLTQHTTELGIDPPKGVLLYGPPGTGKTLSARAVANRTDACFIRVIGSELVQKYVGEGARMVRELFQMARTKKACIIFFDEVDAIGGSRFDGESNSDNEVQRTMLQIVTELDGFDPRGNIKVLMATNRPDTLDPALARPGRLDRKVEFGLPDLEGRAHIFKIHTKTMSCDRNIRSVLLASRRLLPFYAWARLVNRLTD